MKFIYKLVINSSISADCHSMYFLDKKEAVERFDSLIPQYPHLKCESFTTNSFWDYSEEVIKRLGESVELYEIPCNVTLR